MHLCWPNDQRRTVPSEPPDRHWDIRINSKEHNQRIKTTVPMTADPMIVLWDPVSFTKFLIARWSAHDHFGAKFWYPITIHLMFPYGLLNSGKLLAELWQPEGPPSGAPYSYRKEKETHELIFSWLSWLAVLLVGAYAQRRRRSCPTWGPHSK